MKVGHFPVSALRRMSNRQGVHLQEKVWVLLHGPSSICSCTEHWPAGSLSPTLSPLSPLCSEPTVLERFPPSTYRPPLDRGSHLLCLSPLPLLHAFSMSLMNLCSDSMKTPVVSVASLWYTCVMIPCSRMRVRARHGYLIGYVSHFYCYRLCIRYDGSKYSNSNLSPGPRARWSQHQSVTTLPGSVECCVVCSV